MPNETNAIEIEIARLRDLDLGSLKQQWRSAFGRSAPLLSKALLLRLLAYRLQAHEFGDLSPSTKRLLDGLAIEIPGEREPSAIPLPGEKTLMRGAVLIREHDGQQHHVMVVDGGFSWNGTTYPSLSKVAHATTGTKWNGPRFFGLREKEGTS